MQPDLVIVGAGAAGTHVLAALAQENRPTVHHIVVLDATSDLGPGLAYGDAADPRHTLGRVPWRRHDKGNGLRRKLASAVATLRERRVTVELHEQSPARSLHKNGDGWCVETRRGTVAAERCVL